MLQRVPPITCRFLWIKLLVVSGTECTYMSDCGPYPCSLIILRDNVLILNCSFLNSYYRYFKFSFIFQCKLLQNEELSWGIQFQILKKSCCTIALLKYTLIIQVVRRSMFRLILLLFCQCQPLHPSQSVLLNSSTKIGVHIELSGYSIIYAVIILLIRYKIYFGYYFW